MTRRKTAEYHGNPFFRTLVLMAVNASDGWLTARKISEISGLGYKPTVDALQYLLHTEKVARSGRKSTARWGRLCLIEKRDTSEESAILVKCLLRGYMQA